MARPLTFVLTATPFFALGLGVFVSSCSDTSHRSSGGEPTASTQSAIENGKPINVTSDPVSSEFPLSTVFLETTVNDAAAGKTYVYSCTGTIISPTQILTAAHCTLNQTTNISLYSTVPGTGMYPTAVVSAAGATFSYPPGVVCLPPYPGNCIPVFLSCLTGAACTASTGTFADLAIINLSSPITGHGASVGGAYRPAVLGAPGTFDETYDRFSSWAVGTGYMNVLASGGHYVYDDAGEIEDEVWDASNASVENDSHGMQWVPLVLWLPGGTNDDKGQFDTLVRYTDQGDSGGPLYESAAPADAGPSDAGADDLTLIGVLHGRTEDGKHSTYTSVENAVNNAWILGEIQTALATFGASTGP